MVSRDDMPVRVADNLTGRRSIIDANIESIRAKSLCNFRRAVSDKDRHLPHYRQGRRFKRLKMITRDHQRMTARNRVHVKESVNIITCSDSFMREFICNDLAEYAVL